MAPSACQAGAPQTPCRARAHAQSISWRALACHSGNQDRKSTRLNSSHANTSYAVFCLKKKRGKFHAEQANPAMRALHFIYRPVLRFALNHRVLTVAFAVLLFSGAIILATGIGKEFMPPLIEGDLMFMPVTDPAISIDEAIKITGRQDEILKSVPEVEWAVGKAGLAETSTDPSPTNLPAPVVSV